MRYLLTVIDRFLRALLLHWIARYGVPSDIVADRGAQFTASLWRKLCELFGIQTNTTTAYHPQGNGMVERLHRQLKAAIMAREEKADWMEHLPLVLLGIRSAWRADLDGSPTELTFGMARPCTCPAKWSNPPTHRSVNMLSLIHI